VFRTAHTKFLTAGRFPTEGIVKFCRERQWLSLEDIHLAELLTCLPADFARSQPHEISLQNLTRLAAAICGNCVPHALWRE
jgi:hypothetical protein